MDMDQDMIVAGIGCRKGATAEEVETAIKTALEQTGCAGNELVLMATSDGKGDEPGIRAAAAARGLRLLLVRPAELEAVATRTQSSSPRVKALAGVPSVAEAAALFAAGPKSELIAPRIVAGPVTWPLVRTEALP